jgi:ubiquitin-conjugating enzyme E2 Q
MNNATVYTCFYCGKPLGEEFSPDASDYKVNLCGDVACMEAFYACGETEGYVSQAILGNGLETAKLLTYLYGMDSHGCLQSIGTSPRGRLLFSEVETIFNKIKKEKLDDVQIKERLGDRLYRAVRYSLLKFRINLQIDFVEKDRGFTCYKVRNPNEIEDTFRDNFILTRKSHHKYHGSSVTNWFSIIANGIKNYSYTNNMTTGAAYGPGVYLSNQYSMSLCYAKNSDFPILGIYEVCGDVSLYKKASNVWVVPDDKKLILRYLLVNWKNMVEINAWLDMRFAQSYDVALCKGSKRLWKEYQMSMQISGAASGIYIDLPDEGNLLLWDVRLSGFGDSQLEMDMQRWGVDHVKLRVLFSQDYPFYPPFIYVLYPKFQYQTAHITSQGAICMELLTPSGWSQLMTMENVLIQIKTLILEGGGRLSGESGSYTMEAAKSSFTTVAKSHGWL